jgi:CBS domain-containing protein
MDGEPEGKGALASAGEEALRARKVEDIMTTRVYTVTASWTLLATARLLRRHHISGVPVVDDQEAPIGVVSESDIVESLHQAAGVASLRGILDLLLASARLSRPELLDQAIAHLRRTKVRDVMSDRAVTVEPATSIGEAARTLHRYRVNRLPVVRGGKIIGIVTRQDVVEALQHGPELSLPETHGRRFTRGRTRLELLAKMS